MSGVILHQVPPGLHHYKVFEYDLPAFRYSTPDGPIAPTAEEISTIVLHLTCEPGNSLHAAVHRGTLHFWLDPHVSPTDSDRDRWAALTGEYPRW